MNKKTKAMLFISGAIGFMAAANYYIFKKAAKTTRRISESYYDWRFGKIRYIVAGSGEPILLVHGVGLGKSLYEWEKNIENLSKHYKVYALDLLGFGFSDKPKLSYSSYLYVSLINDFVENIIKKPVNIVAEGSSTGFALMAHSFKPEYFKKMLLVSSEETSCSALGKNTFWLKAFIELPVVGTFFYNLMTSRAYIKWFLKEKSHNNGAVISPGLINKYYACAHHGGEAAKYPVAALFSDYFKVNTENALTLIDIPVTIICGENSGSASCFNKIKCLNRNIRTLVFSGAKYMPHAENSKEFYKLCRKFF